MIKYGLMCVRRCGFIRESHLLLSKRRDVTTALCLSSGEQNHDKLVLYLIKASHRRFRNGVFNQINHKTPGYKVTTTGLEPAIFGSVDRRHIH